MAFRTLVFGDRYVRLMEVLLAIARDTMTGG